MDDAEVSQYGEADTEGRLSWPAFPRSSPGLIAALAPWVGQMAGTVLEIGCGTGQQSAAFARAFPALTWVASDINGLHRRSAEAWAATLGVPPIPARAVDAAGDWAEEVADLGPLSAVYSSNVVHIAPWAVAEGLVRGAATALAPGGLLIFAGPFRVYGRDVSPGNAAFDADLRARDPDWGIRDIGDLEALAEPFGLGFAGLVALPANNRLFLLRKV